MKGKGSQLGWEPYFFSDFDSFASERNLTIAVASAARAASSFKSSVMRPMGITSFRRRGPARGCRQPELILALQPISYIMSFVGRPSLNGLINHATGKLVLTGELAGNV